MYFYFFRSCSCSSFYRVLGSVYFYFLSACGGSCSCSSFYWVLGLAYFRRKKAIVAISTGYWVLCICIFLRCSCSYFYRVLGPVYFYFSFPPAAEAVAVAISTGYWVLCTCIFSRLRGRCSCSYFYIFQFWEQGTKVLQKTVNKDQFSSKNLQQYI